MVFVNNTIKTTAALRKSLQFMLHQSQVSSAFYAFFVSKPFHQQGAFSSLVLRACEVVKIKTL